MQNTSNQTIQTKSSSNGNRTKKKSIKGTDRLSSTERKIISNDFSQLWGRRGMRLLLVGVPIVMAVIIPIAFFVVISLFDADSAAKIPNALVNLLDDNGKLNYRQMMAHAFVTLICPVFYLSIPIISAIAISTSSFVMEAEEQTLETLMLSAVSPREIYNAKFLGSMIITVAISLVSFVAFAITASVGNFVLWTPFFFTPSWLIMILGLMPAISALCIILVSLKLSKIHNSKESIKVMGYFMLAIVLFYIMQIAGVYRINSQLLLLISLALIVLDVFLFNLSWRKFTPEEQLFKHGTKGVNRN